MKLGGLLTFILLSYSGVLKAGPDFETRPIPATDSIVVVHAQGDDQNQTEVTVGIANGVAADKLMADLPEMQKRDAVNGPVNTIIFDENTPEQVHEMKVKRQVYHRNVIFGIVRPLLSGATYFLFFPGISMETQVATAAFSILLNMYFAQPEKWNKVRTRLQKILHLPDVGEKGEDPKLAEISSRLTVNVVWGGATNTVSTVLTGGFSLYDFAWKLARNTAFGIFPSAVIEESLNRWTFIKRSAILTEGQFVNLNTLRSLTFSVLGPMVQSGSKTAIVVTGILLTGGALSFPLGREMKNWVEGKSSAFSPFAKPEVLPITSKVRSAHQNLVRAWEGLLQPIQTAKDRFADVHLDYFGQQAPIRLNLNCRSSFR